MQTEPPAILVVDDESGIRDFLADVLTDAGYTVSQAGDGAEALAQLEDRPFDVMFLDLRMPGELGGMDVLRRARANWPELQIIVLTAHGTVENAVAAMRIGAFDFLEKPIAGPEAIRRLVARARNWRTASRQPVLAASAGAGTGIQPSGALQHFLWQLKQRHVYNVAVSYGAIGFLILQAAELILPVLPVPDWTYSMLTVLVLAGFPVALVLGWLYDFTATGVERTRSPESGLLIT